MIVKPTNDSLLVELVESESGVAIATDDTHKSINRGIVVAVSDAVAYLILGTNAYEATAYTHEYMRELSGRTVYFRRYADQDCAFSQDGKKYALIHLLDVMGVV